MAAGGDKKLDGAAQIAVLRSLNQQAAAFLIGQSARALRDRTDAPRLPTGEYDGPALVSWWRGRIDRDCNLTETEHERLNVFADVLMASAFECEGAGITFKDELTELRMKHGDGICALLVDEMFARLNYSDAIRAGAFKFPSEAELVQRYRKEAAEGMAESRLRIAVQCDICERWRFGRTWKKGSKPAGAVEGPRSCCDECSVTIRTPPQQEPDEPDVDDLDDEDELDDVED